MPTPNLCQSCDSPISDTRWCDSCNATVTSWQRGLVPFAVRPEPTAVDLAVAERFVAEVYDDAPAVSRAWLANHRPSLIRTAAMFALGKRQDAERRALSRPVPEMIEEMV